MDYFYVCVYVTLKSSCIQAHIIISLYINAWSFTSTLKYIILNTSENYIEQIVSPFPFAVVHSTISITDNITAIVDVT